MYTGETYIPSKKLVKPTDFSNFNWTDKQTVFNYLLDRIVEQGNPCIEYRDGTTYCVYVQEENRKADRCILGHCLAPMEVTTMLKRDDSDDKDRYVFRRLRTKMKVHEDYLQDLQYIHDLSPTDENFLDDFTRRMYNHGIAYNLALDGVRHHRSILGLKPLP